MMKNLFRMFLWKWCIVFHLLNILFLWNSGSSFGMLSGREQRTELSGLNDDGQIGILSHHCVTPPMNSQLQTREETDPILEKRREELPDAASTENMPTFIVSETTLTAEVDNLLCLLEAKSHLPKHSLVLLKEILEETDACVAYHDQALEPGRLRQNVQKELRKISESYLQRMIHITEKRRILSGQLSQELEVQRNLISGIQTILTGAPILVWEEEWHKECSLFRWWRSHSLHCPPDLSFISWKEDLVQGTRRSRIHSAQSPNLHIEYTSSLWSRCSGVVRVFAAPKDAPTTKEQISLKNQALNKQERTIARIKEKIEELTQEETAVLEERGKFLETESVVTADFCAFHEQKRHIFTEQALLLRKALETYQQINSLYEQHQEQLDMAEKAIKEFQTGNPFFKKFAQLYPRLKLSMFDLQGSDSRFREDFTDQVFDSILLDPVRISCPDNGHGKVYERRKIEEALEQNDGRCFICGQVIRKLLSLPSQEENIAQKIQEISQQAFKAGSIMQDMTRGSSEASV